MDIEKRLVELERRHDRTRQLLIGAITLAAAMSVAALIAPDSLIYAFAIGAICKFTGDALLGRWVNR
jgi:hypothetical protein